MRIQGITMLFPQLSRSEFYKDLFYYTEIDIKNSRSLCLLEAVSIYSSGVTERAVNTENSLVLVPTSGP